MSAISLAVPGCLAYIGWVKLAASAFSRLACSIALILCPWLAPAHAQAPKGGASGTIVVQLDRTAPPKSAAAQPPDYSNEPVVVEHNAVLYRYNADGTGERTVRSVMHVQSEAMVRQLGVLNLGFAAESETVELRYIRVRKPDGTVIATDLSTAQDMPVEVTRQAPLYSDGHQLQIPVRSLAVGDRLEYEAVIHMRKAEAPGEFWGTLQSDAGFISLDEQAELRFPRTREVTVLSPSLKPEISSEGGNTVYRWHTAQLKPTVAPPGAANFVKEEAPAKQVPDIGWTTFRDWAAVGEWYRGLAVSRAEPTEVVRTKAAALIAGAATEDEKLDRIYSFVAMQIHYIGVDFGVGRYQPHPAAEVLANGYGDCKDKHTLLAALLASAGFRVDPVLIGGGLEMDKDLPAPNAFNHLITAVERQGNNRLWLDSTAEVAPPGMLSPVLRDKDALLIPAAEPPSLVKTPAAPPFPAFDRYESHATLTSEGKLTAHFEVTMRGDLELLFRSALFAGGRAQWPEIGQGMSATVGFGGKVTKFTPVFVDTPAEPLHYTYEYERDPYGDWPNHRILALLPDALFAFNTLDKQPDKPIELAAPRQESGRSTILLPEGFSVGNLPSDLHARSSFATFDITYTLHPTAKGQELVSEGRLEIKTPTIPASKWDEYNTFGKDIEAGNGIFIEIAKAAPAAEGGNSGPATAPSVSPSRSTAQNTSHNTDAGAQSLLVEASASAQRGNYVEAQAKLDQARAINPGQQGLWLLAGVLAARNGEHFSEAEADFKKELDLHPEMSDTVLPIQLWAERLGKQNGEAIGTLEAMRKAKPEDVALTREEAALLTAEKRHEEAVSLLEGVALRNPSDKTTMLALGSAQFAAGRTKEAQTTLETALEGATDPETLNDAAYQLADHNLDLPAAAEDASRAVDLLDDETAKVSLDTVTPRDLERQNLLSAAWDTVGWIACLEGNTVEAENYLRAAWSFTERPEVGYHLGILYEKEGKPKQALETYTLSNASRTDSSAPEIAALLKRKDALGAGGGQVSFPGGAGTALSEMRTLHLPLLVKEHKEADFLVLASAQAIEKVEFLEGDPALRSQSSAIGSALGRDRSALPFPAGSGAKLVRRGVLSCSPLIKACQFSFYLPEDTHLPLQKSGSGGGVQAAQAGPP